MILRWPLELTCWRQFAAQQGDCNKSRIAPLNAIIIVAIIIIIIIIIKVFGCGAVDGNQGTEPRILNL